MTDADQLDEVMLVNKRELATRILKCSLPTLNSLLDRYPDFPVFQRGANGVEWQFDAVAVTEFLRTQREDEEQQLRQRADALKQFSLPIDDVVAPGVQQTLSPTQRAQLAKARLAERKLAVEAGMLVSKAEMRQVLTGVFARLGSFLDTLPGQIARSHSLPEEVARSMRVRIDEQRRQVVKEIQDYLADDEAAADD